MPKRDNYIRCQFCLNQIRKSNISHHIKNKHPQQHRQSKKHFQCIIDGCDIPTTKRHLRYHIKKYHKSLLTKSVKQIKQYLDKKSQITLSSKQELLRQINSLHQMIQFKVNK